MSGILTYTVGGNIRNRTANRRGRAAAERFAYDETETLETETGRNRTAETERTVSATRCNTL